MAAKDIARLFGCSLITVSRALNGRDDDPHVSAEMRQKIRQAAEELNYVQSRSARTLRLGKSKSIGIVSTCLCGHFHSCNIDAFFRESLRRGYQFKIVLTQYDKSLEEAALRDLLQEQPDGILYQPFLDCDSPIARHLEKQNYPMLLLGGASAKNKFDEVNFDQETFWDDVLRALVERGHREIVIQGKVSDEILHQYSRKYDLDLECMLQRGPTRAMLNENYEKMRRRNVRALVCMQSMDAQNYFRFLQERREPCPDTIGVYGIPEELFIHEHYLGAIVADLRDYVELCFDRLVFALETPAKTHSESISRRRFMNMEELTAFQKQQIEDSWYALYTT